MPFFGLPELAFGTTRSYSLVAYLLLENPIVPCNSDLIDTIDRLNPEQEDRGTMGDILPVSALDDCVLPDDSTSNSCSDSLVLNGILQHWHQVRPHVYVQIEHADLEDPAQRKSAATSLRQLRGVYDGLISWLDPEKPLLQSKPAISTEIELDIAKKELETNLQSSAPEESSHRSIWTSIGNFFVLVWNYVVEKAKALWRAVKWLIVSLIELLHDFFDFLKAKVFSKLAHSLQQIPVI